MHGKLDLANAKGLKKSEIQQLERLLTKRIPKDKILTLDLADTVAEISHEIGHPVSVVINRRGQVVNVTVGAAGQVNTPELRGVRVGPGRLCGHRIVQTHLNSDTVKLAKKKASIGDGDDTTSNGTQVETFSKESLQCLARNRLDLLAQIEVDPQGPFSRAHGEHAKMADVVYIAHLLPGRDSEGRLWKVLPPQTARGAQEDDFEELISSLEDEFRTQAPGLPVAEGEERAVLVDLISASTDSWQVEDDLDELAQLARAAGATICGRITQARPMPHPKHFLGSGKVQEVALMAQELGANLVIIDQELSPAQQRNLEDMVGVKVLDRTELILDIFSQRARTKEGKLQVELAQLKYLYPRLIGKGQVLSRLGGGIGTRGPGETKLEVDRRRIRSRINALEKETERIRSYRDTQRRQRVAQNLPVVALVGYTNSGKSTLLNALTKSDVFVEDKLFATLDPTTRKTVLPDGSTFLISDTVGFIKKLPTSLVAAFRATLEEVSEADVLLHVVDSSHPNVLDQIVSVFDVLSELSAVDKPIITVLNKADKVRPEDLAWLAAQVPSPIITSATNRIGFGSLLTQVQELLSEVRPDRQRSSA
ncbi:MAG: GTPase HflX [Candidatus Obscuribacterales bacterium]|nr:GTPase HflX [Candidatus Obscuribacterales bacterium]